MPMIRSFLILSFFAGCCQSPCDGSTGAEPSAFVCQVHFAKP
jgi:hypothetical protein